MKKRLILCALLFLAAGAVFADVTIKLYPGLYMGRDQTLTWGADVQFGVEFGDWDDDEFIFGIYADGGIDWGLPNKPNLYYGGMAELYYGESVAKFGIAAGVGWNQGVDAEASERNLQSVYIRLGIPFNFVYGRFKMQLCLDIYPDVGVRLGFLFHFGINLKKFTTY
ncbi:MAG: hypothetical protein LBG76_00630 [Treponema sp.]|jgi:hypothetical protein|nr:hypothetical protein [Treponema sp.]